MRWPKEPPHLALNAPSLLGFVLFCSLFVFVFFLFFLKKNLFPPPPVKRAFVFIFQRLPLRLTFFHSPFFNLSFSVSLSLSLFLVPSFSFFLPCSFIFSCFLRFFVCLFLCHVSFAFVS